MEEDTVVALPRPGSGVTDDPLLAVLREGGGVADGEPIRFTSAVLPAYLRRTRNIEELLPWLYLKGVSTGQSAEALTALLGPEAPGLSPATVRRLTEGWQEEHERWQQRDLSARRYVYLW